MLVLDIFWRCQFAALRHDGLDLCMCMPCQGLRNDATCFPAALGFCADPALCSGDLCVAFSVPIGALVFPQRAERVIAQLNTRLQRPIEPFKLARRHDMIQRLIYDPEITQAM